MFLQAPYASQTWIISLLPRDVRSIVVKYSTPSFAKKDSPRIIDPLACRRHVLHSSSAFFSSWITHKVLCIGCSISIAFATGRIVGWSIALMLFVISSGSCDINSRERQCTSPLQWVIIRWNPKIVEVILILKNTRSAKTRETRLTPATSKRHVWHALYPPHFSSCNATTSDAGGR